MNVRVCAGVCVCVCVSVCACCFFTVAQCLWGRGGAAGRACAGVGGRQGARVLLHLKAYFGFNRRHQGTLGLALQGAKRFSQVSVTCDACVSRVM